jgi:Holliday junction DNA helicase RuvA
MIGYLSGNLLEIDGSDILIDVNGVGYRVRVVNVEATRNKLQETREISLYIHTYVKEDQLSLFGFETKKALKFFQLLINVSGVGPKSAMGILAHGTPDQVQQAVVQADVSFFTKVSGIGKKNGQRIIVDLKSKLGSVADLDLSEPEIGTDDVFDALVQMGFESKKVQQTLASIDRNLGESEQIKLAIRSLTT